MNLLFDDKVLFNEGKKHFTDFTLPGAQMKLWEQFFSKEESDRYYKAFLNSPWAQHRRKMYDKIVADPRLTVWYGKNGMNEWTADLLDVKTKIEVKCGIVFDSVLLNFYRDGNDSVAWHSDTLPSSGKHHAIASVTFGATRIFKVRRKNEKYFQPIDILLILLRTSCTEDNTRGWSENQFDIPYI
jgi:alkylated DNA repair dioxygenase AlkB